THPSTGLQRRLKFPPTIAEVVEACEDHARSWYDPSKAPSLDPSAMPAALQQIFAGNRAALALYGGAMTDPTLAGRLAAVAVPARVLWGEADRIADAEYGRAFAAAIPGARFELLPHTGHVPQMETPELLLNALGPFVREH
ncbi:MAG: alpha/beta fold hydrolase, partial [Actinomycetota bacterium]